MRFLHSSDWHVGRTIRGRSRDAEHEAALGQMLSYAREHDVDCLLIAGDVFDTSAPSPESERIVYDFFRELHGAGIPAVVIAGNHDHPRRFEAIAPLLRSVNVHALGDPRPVESGGVVEVRSQDGRETALIAAMPWITERRAVEFGTLQKGPEAALLGYAQQLASVMQGLSSGFHNDYVNILMAHALINDSIVSAGGGERGLHMSMGIYGVPREQLPAQAQYVALGHVHKAQALVKSPPAWYSGSLLQLDFGEVNDVKSVNLIEVHPRLPAQVTQLPINRGVRRLIDIGTPFQGVRLDELAGFAASAGDAWLRVFIDLDLPVANLPALVHEQLPNAVSVERSHRSQIGDTDQATAEARLSGGAEELFAAFYSSRLGRGSAASAATLSLFRRLLEEEGDATSEA